MCNNESWHCNLMSTSLQCGRMTTVVMKQGCSQILLQHRHDDSHDFLANGSMNGSMVIDSSCRKNILHVRRRSMLTGQITQSAFRMSQHLTHSPHRYINFWWRTQCCFNDIQCCSGKFPGSRAEMSDCSVSQPSSNPDDINVKTTQFNITL